MQKNKQVNAVFSQEIVINRGFLAKSQNCYNKLHLH